MKAAVLDIGGSSIKYGRLDERLIVEQRGKIPAPLTDMNAFYSALDRIWEEVGTDAEGLAVSMPGVIDSSRGYAYTGGALQYIRSREVARELTDRYQVPVWIGNDAKCAGSAEAVYGALQGVRTGIVVILGTGIGGCLILDGKVYTGIHFSAGEFSFLHTNRYAPYDQSEWWARVTGSSGLLAMVQNHTKSTDVLSGEEIFARAEQGDMAVLQAVDQFAETVAVQLLNLQCILDAEKIAIGGGISAQPLLIQKLKEQSDRIYKDYPYPFFQPEITVCRFRNDANLIGAYSQLLERENG